MTATELIEATAAMLRDEAERRGMNVTGDGRVSEADAAVLLGCEADTLAKKRAEGRAPASYRIAVGGARVSYRIADMAAWIEAQRD